MNNANNLSTSKVRSDVILNRDTKREKSTKFLLKCKSILQLEETEPVPVIITATYVFPFCLFYLDIKQKAIYVSYINLVSNVSIRA
jgi:hypothetical protein